MHFVLQMLEYKFNKHRVKVDKMLDLYVNKDGQIDVKKNFDEVLELFSGICKVYFCYDQDLGRQRKRKTDPDTIRRMKEFFHVIFADNHGISYFEK